MKLNDRYLWLTESLGNKGIDVSEIEDKMKSMVVELPSWAVGNSGTRYGTFRDKGAAANIWQKIDDCAEIQRVLGICPVMASHVLWDVTEDGEYAPVREYAESKNMTIGTVHPNTFQGQAFRYGSLCSPIDEVRQQTNEHFEECVRMAREMNSKVIGMWVADGTNYPGQDDLIARKHRLFDGLKHLYDAMDDDMMMVLEYKPFEPFFYTSDVQDWGMSKLMCDKLGDRAKVLVDLGHHLAGVNIEQIIAILLDEKKLGGFHFNNRRYADDDLITGTVKPLEMFLIFKEIVDAGVAGLNTDIVYMLDQSHNIEPSIEGIIYSVMNIQTAYTKALLLDRAGLKQAQADNDVIKANMIVMDAFNTDVAPLIEKVRLDMGLSHVNPIENYRQGGYAAKIEDERGFAGINTLGG